MGGFMMPVMPSFQENEIVGVVIGAAVVIFLVLNSRKLKEIIPVFWCLSFSFLFLFLSEVATNLEAVRWPAVMNFLEHFSHLLSSFFLLLWCEFSLPRERERK